MSVGIEALNLYGGPTFMDVRTLFEARELDLERFANLMMYRKSVSLPCEDPVTNGVNAALPIIKNLNEEERASIEMVIASSESGIDFGKAMSTYMHDHLGLPKTARLFELKQACYGGTAALQMAVNFVLSGVAPGRKVLVIATDIARGLHADDGLHYAEPSQGTGAVAMLVSDKPKVFEVDAGAYGLHSYEVMDTCRPRFDLERGDPDLSLLSYLDCLDGAYRNYTSKVDGVDLRETFDYLAFHTPFAGMVKGAHRKLMRSILRARPAEIDADFQNRVTPSLAYCQQVGNVYSATVYFALCSLIDNASYTDDKRVGLFSYGSGCSSEFFSGLINPGSQQELRKMDIEGRLAARFELDMPTYERLQTMGNHGFGQEDWDVSLSGVEHIYDHFFKGKGYLVLKGCRKFHREYAWS